MFSWIRNRRGDFQELATARSEIAAFPLAGSLIATYIGPGLSIGLTGQVYEHGWIYVAVTSAYVFQLLAVGFLIGPLIKRKFESAQSLGDILLATVPNPSTGFVRASGAFAVLIMVGVCAIMIKIGGQIMAQILPIQPLVASIGITIIVAAYTTIGGLRTAIWTDNTQLAIYLMLTLTLSVLTVLVLYRTPISDHAYPENLSYIDMISLIVAFACGDFLQPPFVQRILAARSATALRAAYSGTAICLMCWFFLMGLLGSSARDLGIHTASADDVFFSLANFVLPGIGGKIAALVVLLIVMSSFTSVLNSAATVLVKDVLRLKLGTTSNISAGIFQRVATVLLAAIGFVLCQSFSSIMFGILFLASIWAPAMLVPVISLLFVKQRDHLAAIVAMIVGGLTSFVSNFMPVIGYVPPILIGILASLATFCIVHAVRSLVRPRFAT